MPRAKVIKTAVKAVRTRKAATRKVNTMDKKRFNTSTAPTNYIGQGSFKMLSEINHGVSGYQSTGISTENAYQMQRRATADFVVPNMDPATSGYDLQSHVPQTAANRSGDPAFSIPRSDPTATNLNFDFDDEALTLQSYLYQAPEALSIVRDQQSDLAQAGNPSGFREGYSGFDPAIQSMINDESITTEMGTPYHQPSSYVHLPTNMPSTIQHHFGETATEATFSGNLQFPETGNQHTHLAEHRTPALAAESNVSAGTHQTHGDAHIHQTSGTVSFSFSKERPLTLQDFAMPPQPQIRPSGGLNRPTKTSVSAWY